MLSHKVLAAKRWTRELKRRYLAQHRHRVGTENYYKEREVGTIAQIKSAMAALPPIPQYTPPAKIGLKQRLVEAFRRRATRGI